MNRRNFLKGLGAIVGGIAVEQAIPFNRVWSFPSKIVIPNKDVIMTSKGGKWELIDRDDYITKESLQNMFVQLQQHDLQLRPIQLVVPPELLQTAREILKPSLAEINEFVYS